jgi:DNA-binding response OmpR family regulator
MQDRLILVVDDDPKIRALLRACFEGEGARVVEATNLGSVQQAFAQEIPDLVTLDIGLGGDSGLDIARDLRRSHDTPIIMVTGKDDVIDRIVGLELGADDYVTKPFHIREMLARANSVLRRYAAPARAAAAAAAAQADPDAGAGWELDGLRIDLDRMLVWDRNGQDCNLTTADFKLLRALLDNAKRPLSRDRLMDLIGGPQWVPLDRTIDNQVARLRKKIERDPAHPLLIKTVRGIGYMLTETAQGDHPGRSRTA